MNFLLATTVYSQSVWNSAAGGISTANYANATSSLNVTTSQGLACLPCTGSSIVWAVNTACYCGSTAQAITNCVAAKNPAWPLVPIDPAVLNKDCGSPTENPTAYTDCINAKSPKQDPNANQEVADCISSTGAQVSVGSANGTTGSSNNVTGSNPGSSTTPTKNDAQGMSIFGLAIIGAVFFF
ncbi:hypothetical protein HDV04_000577 [Boothiomyces sp. JEL0838]|nr:hypothetical protein HDV04_000577 [Boothiomyces sp. JEL0838]